VGIARGIGRQLAWPSGLAGSLLGRVMDLANRAPSRLAIDLLAARSDERVLDIGCGTGAAARRLLGQAGCRITCVDRSATMLDAARKRMWRSALDGVRRAGEVEFHAAELGALPFAAGQFDAVLALNMLYFCDEDGAMLRDLWRVLLPGGRLVAYVTHRDTMARWPFVRHGTHRLFDGDELAAALVAGGFARDRVRVHEVRVPGGVRGLLAHAMA